MKEMGTDQGFAIALISSILLLATAAGSALLTGAIAYYMGVEHHPLQWIATETRLPILLQFVWLFMVLATAGVVVSLFVHGFRARWFWRCLVAASCMWLISPPLHTVIGLIALIVLLNTQKYFPHGANPETAAP